MTHRSPIQHLEPRRLLADFATLSAGTLTLTGTTGNDSFTLLERSGKLRVIGNGVEVRFTASAVKKITATLDAGNDSFVMNSALAISATVFGGDGDDTITTAGGADRIEGSDGNDLLAVGAGSNIATGGDGDDLLDYLSSSQKAVGYLYVINSSNPTFPTAWIDSFDTRGTIRRGNDQDSATGIERIGGTRYGDSIEMRMGAPRQNTGYASVPTVQLLGNGGNDSLRITPVGGLSELVDGPGFPFMRLTGGDGEDFIEIPVFMSPGAYDGDSGDDAFAAPSTFGIENIFQSISGGDGTDRLTLGATLYVNYQMPSDLENFTLESNAGNPGGRIFGNSSSNRIDIRAADRSFTVYGGDGDDIIYGGIANDSIRGDAGDDLIFGGDGADRIYGGDGNDTIDGQGGRDFVYAGAGTDRATKQSNDRVFDSIESLS